MTGPRKISTPKEQQPRLVEMSDDWIPEVVELRRNLLGEPPNPGFLRAGLRNKNQVNLIALAGEQLVAHGAAQHAGEESQLISLAVDSGWQSRGIATMILEALMQSAVEAGSDSFWLEVRLSNHRAQNLYRRFGFAPVSIRPGYYPPVAKTTVANPSVANPPPSASPPCSVPSSRPVAHSASPSCSATPEFSSPRSPREDALIMWAPDIQK